MTNYLPLIIGMALVTYIPRLLPLVTLSNKNINKKTKSFLGYIPVTSLSILIIRGILTSASDMRIATIAGITAAAIISYIKGNMVLSVLAGILTSYLILR